jgi:hypothetical protein
MNVGARFRLFTAVSQSSWCADMFKTKAAVHAATPGVRAFAGMQQSIAWQMFV